MRKCSAHDPEFLVLSQYPPESNTGLARQVPEPYQEVITSAKQPASVLVSRFVSQVLTENCAYSYLPLTIDQGRSSTPLTRASDQRCPPWHACSRLEAWQLCQDQLDRLLSRDWH